MQHSSMETIFGFQATAVWTPFVSGHEGSHEAQLLMLETRTDGQQHKGAKTT